MTSALGLIAIITVCYGFIVTRPGVTDTGSIAIWFLGAICCGLVTSSGKMSFPGVLGTAAGVAILYTIIPVGFVIRARLIREASKDAPEPSIKGVRVPKEMELAKFIVRLMPLHWLGTFVVFIAALFAREAILTGLKHGYDFGEKGLKNVASMINAGVAILSAGGASYWAYRSRSGKKAAGHPKPKNARGG